jgi:hypothetical protein
LENILPTQKNNMKRFLRFILHKPILWFIKNFSASPKRDKVFSSLTALYERRKNKNDSKVKVIQVNLQEAKYIIFSDQHKGDKSAADDFANNALNYEAALDYYYKNNFHLISLGDCEELWKFTPDKVLAANKSTFEKEALFHPNRFCKTFGNHDLIWKNIADVFLWLRKYFSFPLKIYEGIVINLTQNNYPDLQIFLTHGHQGDTMSDNNAFSTWCVAHLWLPLQRFLNIKINTPSKDYSLRNKHNIMMSDWSSQQKNLLLVTGHTHSPVFASGKYLNHPSNNIPGKNQQHIKPTYFNAGCCCFDDGDITGIEIENGMIRLIKWCSKENILERKILEEIELDELKKEL